MSATPDMRLLVSVRGVDEALLAAAGGADFIDLKEPRSGALGGLPLATIAAIVAALRAAGHALPVSATIGDLAMEQPGEVLSRVDSVGDRGVDYVKVGIDARLGSAGLLRALARCHRPVVPVLLVDRGLGALLVAQALSGGFAAVMLDTSDKAAGSLLELLPLSVLREFVGQARRAGVSIGLAGALRIEQLGMLLALEPDFAGFRGAVCVGHRAAALDAGRLQALVAERDRLVASSVV